MQKRFFTILFILISFNCYAGYYVSTTGNNSAAGTSPAEAWQTLDKVNAAFIAGTIIAGDTIYLKRGELFFGVIRISKSSIVIKDYASGIKPIMYGYAELTSWTNLGSNNYRASITTVNYVNLLTLNGRPQTTARYPDLSAADAGYMHYDKGLRINNSTGYIIDVTLTGSEGWTGLLICVRTSDFNIDRCVITSQHNDTIFYRVYKGINNSITPQVSPPKPNFSYFIMNSSTFLTERGEWWYDSTGHTVTVNFGAGNTPAGQVVRMAMKDTGIVCGTQSNIRIQNVDFEGYNLFAIFSAGNGLRITNCDVISTGARGLFTNNCANLYIDSMNIYNPVSSGMEAYNRGVNNTSIFNVTVRNAGRIPGMGSFFNTSDYCGMQASIRSGLLIQNCTTDTSGFHGIKFQGSDVSIRYCYNRVFTFTLQDGGGVYTYLEGTARFYRRIVEYCIAEYGFGNTDGCPSSTRRCAGFYSDGKSMNIIFRYNTSHHNARNGSHCNNCDTISYIGNTYYANFHNISFFEFNSFDGAKGYIRNLVITGNSSYLTDTTAAHIYYTNSDSVDFANIDSIIGALGTINNNRYNTLQEVGFQMELYDSSVALIPTAPYSLLGWQSLGGQDLASTNCRQYTPYTITGTVGSTKVTNGNFTAGTGWTTSGLNTTFTYGSGFGQMSFSAPVATTYSSISQAVGSVDATKYYRLRFKTTGTGTNGITRCYLRKTAAPQNNLVTRQIQSFATTGLWHEFFFANPETQASATLVIQINQQSGTTQIDSVSLFEVTGGLNNTIDSVKFAVNPNSYAISYPLPALYHYQQMYSGAIVQGTQLIDPGESLLDLFYRVRTPTPSGTNRIFTPRRPKNVP